MKTSHLSAVALLLSAGCLHAAPVISEFLALNKGPLTDDFEQTSDWIEIHNPDAAAVDLEGWTLTDEPDIRAKWTFPAVSVAPGAYLIVRASGMDRRTPGSVLHTNFTLSGSGEFLALYPPAGDCASCFQPYPKQFAGYSYGRAGNGATGYFAAPTLEAANADTSLSGYTADTQFSVDRGFFTAPFAVTLTCSTPGAVIRYTTNGDEPEATSTAYTAPLNITATTTLRARAFTNGLVPSNTDTQTYIFAANWISQPANPPGLPATWGFSGTFNDGVVVDASAYGMSAAVTAAYASEMMPALTNTLPVLAITTPMTDMFGDSSVHGNLRFGDGEVQAGVEFFIPQNPQERFSSRALFQAHGGLARHLPKKGFRLDFSGGKSDGPLSFPLFPGSNAESFDQLVLRPGGHDSFAGPSRDGALTVDDVIFHASYLRDQFLRMTENEAGLLSPRGRYVHLCLNGLYWGIYDLHERPNAEYCTTHRGGSTADWDVLHHSNFSNNSGFNQVVDGTDEAWDDLQDLATSPITAMAKYSELSALLGLHSYIDHLLIRMWAGDHDWLGPVYTPGVTGSVAAYNAKNWYAVRSTRSAIPGPWQFFTWDAEISMGNHLLIRMIDNGEGPVGLFTSHAQPHKLDLDLTGIAQSGTPAAPWNALKDFPEFRMAVADRAQRLLFNNGPLSPARASARVQGLTNQLDSAMVAESARWGAYYGKSLAFVNTKLTRLWTPSVPRPASTWPQAPSITRDTHWRPEVAWLRDTFAVQRGTILRDQLRARGLFPNTDAPGISLAAGEVTLTAPEGTVYYTVDGADPRQPFGGFEGTAQAYSAPFTAPSGSFTVRARTYSPGGEWSPLLEMNFTTAVAPTAGALAITEVYYHPAAPTEDEITAGFTDADRFEFLEITNLSASAVALSSLRFAAGIDFDFAVNSSMQELAPGASLLLAADPAAFALRFPAAAAPAGQFQNGTNLANSGERIKLVTASGTVIAEFSYDDDGTWPAAADGGGDSLELLAPLSGTDENDGDSWRSDLPTPGTVRTSLAYADWLRDYFTAAEITAGILTAASADPDGDGLQNLMEYFTRLNPRRPSNPPVKFTQPAAGTVRFTWERRADAVGVTGVAQISSPLSGWTTITAGPGRTLYESLTDRGTIQQTFELTPPASGPRQFLRLKVTQP